MKLLLKAVEATGTIDNQGHLHLDEPLTELGPGRTHVILLAEYDIDEEEWLRAAAKNPAFNFLKDVEEDVYTLADGKPFHDQG